MLNFIHHLSIVQRNSLFSGSLLEQQVTHVVRTSWDVLIQHLFVLVVLEMLSHSLVGENALGIAALIPLHEAKYIFVHRNMTNTIICSQRYYFDKKMK